MSPGSRLPVLVAAGGAAWDTRALEDIDRPGSGLTLHKRCVDLADLVATAGTGLARVAVAAADLPGLDADTVASVRRAGLGVVLVADGTATDHERTARLGADVLVGPELDAFAGRVSAAARSDGGPRPWVAAGNGAGGTSGGRTLVVFGPAGAPGRTTVAAGLAAELGHRGHGTLLLDADPFGGAVAQHLGILDEVSGLLAATRLANSGRLDGPALAGAARAMGSQLRVLTGLPRADRWTEVRGPAFEDLLGVAAALDERVVVDVGFDLEHEPGDPFDVAPRRNQMTLTALDRADDVVVVGSADPVGLARLARSLVDLGELLPDAAVRVVVNRTRPTLGWSEEELRTMVDGFGTLAGLTFLPEDRATADKAMMSGRTLVEVGDSPLRRGIADLATHLLGDRDRTPSRRRWPRSR